MLDSILPESPTENFSPEAIHRGTPDDNRRQELVLMITHDLRAPLTNLRLFLELTRSGYYNQSDARFGRRIGQLIPELARIDRLLDALIEFDKLETCLTLKKVPVTDRQLVEAAIVAILHNAQVRDIRIESECADVTLEADQDRITQVIINLLENAIKASSSGGTIWVRSKLEHGNLIISVVDEGIGVNPDDAVRIFERYQQSTTKSKGGFGLGLAISKAIVDRHGGEIGVKPLGSGAGSQFWFTLPAERLDFSALS